MGRPWAIESFPGFKIQSLVGNISRIMNGPILENFQNTGDLGVKFFSSSFIFSGSQKSF